MLLLKLLRLFRALLLTLSFLRCQEKAEKPGRKGFEKNLMQCMRSQAELRQLLIEKLVTLTKGRTCAGVQDYLKVDVIKLGSKFTSKGS